MILCQVTTIEVDDATKLLEKVRQKLQGIQNIPSQRVNDLEAAIRQLRQIGCILDSVPYLPVMDPGWGDPWFPH